MKKGYLAEIEMRHKEIAEVRDCYEKFYLTDLTEEEIKSNQAMVNQIESTNKLLEDYTRSLQGTVKTIKMAIVAWWL